VAPTGRHVLVVTSSDTAGAAARIESIGAAVVAVGSDDLGLARSVGPAHARPSLLGRMQRPPLDGPVDRRATRGTAPGDGAVT
jgi:hypothetical protein